jgi:hypothetical protein
VEGVPSLGGEMTTYNVSGAQTHITTDYDIFVPQDANSEVVAETPWGNSYSYTNC